ncbi:MAG TPA: Asp-tRNA(Asn)/Glu-tRNA(Gln) amidotransferase subunit GatC [Pseudogracilibacillus sp.]|nr:Asp-tRNA(Asn)/Glu-tRNA(Gln) amidotransferase subunit GatC [Pseudogracilibacillus sp.]
MSNIAMDEVKRIADLARLAVTEEDTKMFKEYLDAITIYAEQLNEVDTEGVEPTTHALKLENVMRKDEPKQWTTQEEVLKNAPDHKDGHFRVPSILE